MKGYFARRINTVGIKGRRADAVGFPDIFVLHKGKFFGIEVKDLHGKLSEAQIEFGKQIVLHGGEYLVVRSLDEVMKYL